MPLPFPWAAFPSCPPQLWAGPSRGKALLLQAEAATCNCGGSAFCSGHGALLVARCTVWHCKTKPCLHTSVCLQSLCQKFRARCARAALARAEQNLAKAPAREQSGEPQQSVGELEEGPAPCTACLQHQKTTLHESSTFPSLPLPPFPSPSAPSAAQGEWVVFAGVHWQLCDTVEKSEGTMPASCLGQDSSSALCCRLTALTPVVPAGHGAAPQALSLQQH